MAAILAATAVGAAFLIADAVATAPLVVTMGGDAQTVSLPAAVVSAAIATVVAGAIGVLVTDRSARPRRVFIVVVVVGFVLSLPGAIIGADNTSTALTLPTMHLLVLLAVAAIIGPKVPAHSDCIRPMEIS